MIAEKEKKTKAGSSSGRGNEAGFIRNLSLENPIKEQKRKAMKKSEVCNYMACNHMQLMFAD